MKEDEFLRYTDEPIDEIGEKIDDEIGEKIDGEIGEKIDGEIGEKIDNAVKYVKISENAANAIADVIAVDMELRNAMTVEERLTVMEGMLGYLVVAVEQLSQFTNSFASALKGVANNPMIKMMMPPEIVDSLKDM